MRKILMAGIACMGLWTGSTQANDLNEFAQRRLVRQWSELTFDAYTYDLGYSGSREASWKKAIADVTNKINDNYEKCRADEIDAARCQQIKDASLAGMNATKTKYASDIHF